MIARRLLQVSSGIFLGLVVVLLVLGRQKPGSEAHRFRGTRVANPSPAPDFTLTAHHGAPFTLAEQTGRVTVLFFGFTHCPDVCPTTLARLARAMEILGPAAGEVQVALVTVDPGRDTRERLRDWVTGFHGRFVGLRGDEAELRRVARAYGVHFEAVGPAGHEGMETTGHEGGEDTAPGDPGEPASRPGSGGYDVIHSGRTFVVDARRRLVLTFRPGMPAEAMAEDLKRLVEGG